MTEMYIAIGDKAHQGWERYFDDGDNDNGALIDTGFNVSEYNYETDESSSRNLLKVDFSAPTFASFQSKVLAQFRKSPGQLNQNDFFRADIRNLFFALEDQEAGIDSNSFTLPVKESIYDTWFYNCFSSTINASNPEEVPNYPNQEYRKVILEFNDDGMLSNYEINELKDYVLEVRRELGSGTEDPRVEVIADRLGVDLLNLYLFAREFVTNERLLDVEDPDGEDATPEPVPHQGPQWSNVIDDLGYVETRWFIHYAELHGLENLIGSTLYKALQRGQFGCDTTPDQCLEQLRAAATSPEGFGANQPNWYRRINTDTFDYFIDYKPNPEAEESSRNRFIQDNLPESTDPEALRLWFIAAKNIFTNNANYVAFEHEHTTGEGEAAVTNAYNVAVYSETKVDLEHPERSTCVLDFKVTDQDNPSAMSAFTFIISPDHYGNEIRVVRHLYASALATGVQGDPDNLGAATGIFGRYFELLDQNSAIDQRVNALLLRCLNSPKWNPDLTFPQLEELEDL